MYRNILLPIFFLISSYSYSQPGYPRQIVYRGDTVIAITREQEQLLNLAHINWEQCSEINDSLLVTVDSCRTGFIAADSAIQSLHNQILAYQAIQNAQIATIDTLQIAINDQKRIIHKLKLHQALSRAGEGLLGAVIIWLVLR